MSQVFYYELTIDAKHNTVDSFSASLFAGNIIILCFGRQDACNLSSDAYTTGGLSLEFGLWLTALTGRD